MKLGRAVAKSELIVDQVAQHQFLGPGGSTPGLQDEAVQRFYRLGGVKLQDAAHFARALQVFHQHIRPTPVQAAVVLFPRNMTISGRVDFWPATFRFGWALRRNHGLAAQGRVACMRMCKEPFHALGQERRFRRFRNGELQPEGVHFLFQAHQEKLREQLDGQPLSVLRRARPKGLPDSDLSCFSAAPAQQNPAGNRSRNGGTSVASTGKPNAVASETFAGI